MTYIQHTMAGFPVKASEYIIRIIFSVHSKHAVSPELSPSLKYHATADLKADKEIKDCVYIRARQQRIDNPVFPAKKRFDAPVQWIEAANKEICIFLYLIFLCLFSL